MPALDTVEALWGKECNEEREVGLKELGQLLFYSAGLAGDRVSVRHVYSTEIYLVSTDIPGLEAGVYHFGPGDFSLRRLRSGDYRPELQCAAGDNQGIASAPVTLILSSVFGRGSWKYHDRAYRFCLWDAGAVLANLLAMAAAEELPCSVEMAFVDAQVDHIVGLDGRERASLCLVPLGRSLDWAGHLKRPALEPLSYATCVPSETEAEQRALHQMHAASCLVTDEEPRPWRGPYLESPRR